LQDTLPPTRFGQTLAQLTYLALQLPALHLGALELLF
jgi:hypothetical protein